jgi:hypothetical protein
MGGSKSGLLQKAAATWEYLSIKTFRRRFGAARLSRNQKINIYHGENSKAKTSTQRTQREKLLRTRRAKEKPECEKLTEYFFAAWQELIANNADGKKKSLFFLSICALAFPRGYWSGKPLVNAGAAITDHREEDGQRGWEQYCPADAACPGAEHWNQALVNLIFVDCWVSVRHGVWPPAMSSCRYSANI